ncbi:MAG: thioesterase II family protein [Candidatus Promineifilaceae bacterium]
MDCKRSDHIACVDPRLLGGVQMSAAPWFVQLVSPETAPALLVCFPHAGGSVAHFRGLAQALSGAYEVWAVNMPGHGARWAERAPDDMVALAGRLADELLPVVQSEGQETRPFAFLGHSLGARLAFEVARCLRRRGERLPACLFVAACAAPQVRPVGRTWHTLADDALLAELAQYNGLPAELLAEPELLALFLPALRADLSMFETAVYTPEAPFAFPICALGASSDPLVDVQGLAAWREQTTGLFRLAVLAGDHFFLQKEAAATAAEITTLTADRI